MPGEWGAWDGQLCTAKCGDGKLERTRVCKEGACGGKCVGSSVDRSEDDCSTGPCDDDVIRIRSAGVLTKVVSIVPGSNKKVMVLYANSFLGEATHKYVEALVAQAAYYRKLSYELSAPTGIAFAVVECADDPRLQDTCKELSLAPTDTPQLKQFGKDGTIEYDGEALLHGKLAKIQQGHAPLINIGEINSETLSKLNDELAKAISVMKDQLARIDKNLGLQL
jgi:hypothetical protein